MAEVGSWQNHAFQSYRRRYGDNQFEQKREHALHVCITKSLRLLTVYSREKEQNQNPV